MEISRMEEEVHKSDEGITKTIKVKEKLTYKPLDTSSLPVEVVDLYHEGTTDREGRLKDDFFEIGKEESPLLERVPAKVYILCEFGIRRIKKAQVVVYSPYVQVMAAAYPQKSNMQQALSINSL